MPVKVPVREPSGEVSVILPVMSFTVLGLGSSGDGSGRGEERVVGKLSVRRVVVIIVRVFRRCIVVYGDWS